eukprot:COSAG01_NODE_2320_length_7913_cov_10.332864_11_plen_49_part_00
MGRICPPHSRGCVGCDELVTTLTIDAPSPIRLKTFRNWGKIELFVQRD